MDISGFQSSGLEAEDIRGRNRGEKQKWGKLAVTSNSRDP